MRITHALILSITCGLAGAALGPAAAFAQTGAPSQTTSPAQAAPPGQSQSAPAAAPSETPPNTSPTQSGASSPHQRNVTGQTAPEAPPNTNPGPTGASSPHQRNVTRLARAGAGSGAAVSSGMTVQDQSGQTLGTVSHVVRARKGNRGYVVISGTEAHGSATPVPYHVASSMTKNGIIVLDREAFEQAPKVKSSQILRRSRSRWQQKVDEYWKKHSE